MQEEKDTPEVEIEVELDCDPEPDAKPTQGTGPYQYEPAPPVPFGVQDEEEGDIGIFTSPDGWLNPWDVKKNKK